MQRARGFDVSGYQPRVDFAAARAAGYSFCLIKATEGEHHIDSALAAHRDGVRAHGGYELVVYYHFARPGDPIAQAAAFALAVGPLLNNERLCLDFEADDMLTPGALAWIDAFFTALTGGACRDRRPLIYVSHRIWTLIGDPDWPLASEVDLWAPRYSAAMLEPNLPKPWAVAGRGWTLWQWSNGTIPANTVPGAGAVDADYFNGDEAALRVFARLAPILGP